MKTNSIRKELNEFILAFVFFLTIVGCVFGQTTVTISAQQGAGSFSSVENCGTKYFAKFKTDRYTGPCIIIQINGNNCSYSCSGTLGNTTFSKLSDGYYGDYSHSVGDEFDAYVIVNTSGSGSVEFSRSKPNCGAEISGKPAITSTSSQYCPLSVPVLSVTPSSFSTSGTTSPYPLKKWYKGENPINEANPDASYIVDGPGTYSYRVKVAADKDWVKSNEITITQPTGTPSIVTDIDEINLFSLKDGDPAEVTITSSVENTCGTHTITASLSPDSDVLSDEKFSITAKGNGSFTIDNTYSTASDAEFTGTLYLKSAGLTTVSIPLRGTIVTPLTSVSVADCEPIGGEPGEYVATVVGGVPPLSYDWYVNGSKVATTSVPKYKPASTPSSLYCVVTDYSGAPQTSNTVTGERVEVKFGDASWTTLKFCGEHQYVYTGTISGHDQGQFQIKINGGDNKINEYTKTTSGPGVWANDYYTNYLNDGGTTYTYYFVINTSEKTVYVTRDPNYCDCETRITTPVLTATQMAFCNANDIITLTASATTNNPAPCYPQYVWYKNGSVVKSGDENTITASIDDAGYYSCKIYVNGSTFIETEEISLSTPAPSIALSERTLTLESQKGENLPTKVINPRVVGSCTPEFADFEVTGPFNVVDNHDGTYSVTPTYTNKEVTDDPYTGTITFKTLAVDGVSYITKTEELRGYVFPCSGGEIATFDFDAISSFDQQGRMTSNGITISTIMEELLNSNSADYSDKYRISNTPFFQNADPLNGVSGKAFLVSQGSASETTVLTISGLSPDLKYKISMVAGSNAQYGDYQYAIKLGSTTETFNRIQNGGTYPSYTPAKEGAKIMTSIITSVSSVNITVGKEKLGGDPVNRTYSYFDDIKIEKLCPPTVSVDLTEGAPCAGSGTFTATVSGTGPFTYQWYVNNTLKETIEEAEATSGTLNTWTCSDNLVTNDKVKCVVTDANGLSDESNAYNISCLGITPTLSASEVCIGSDVTAKITAAEKASIESTGEATYQWFKGAIAKSAASKTYSDLALVGVLATDEGSYTLHVTKSDGITYISGAVVLTITKPAFDVNKTSLSLTSGNSYSETVTVSNKNSCYDNATALFNGADAAKFEVSRSGDVYTASLVSAAQSVAGVYTTDLIMYDRDDSNKKTIAVTATVPLNVSEPASERPCVAEVGFTSTVSGTRAGATYTWYVNNVEDASGSIAASTSSTEIAFHPSTDLDVNDVVKLTVETNDGLTQTVTKTITSCGPLTTFTTSLPGFSNGKEYIVCSGLSTTLSFTPHHENATGYTPSFQWYKDGVAIAGATTATYTVNPVFADEHTYKLVAKLTNGGTVFDNSVTVKLNGVSGAYSIDDVKGCGGESINFVEKNNEVGVHWKVAGGSYSGTGTTSNLIETGQTFPSGSSRTYYFAYKSELGNSYCRETSATATGYGSDYIKITSAPPSRLMICKYDNENNLVLSPDVSVTVADCEGNTPAGPVSYQWYRTTIENAIDGAEEITGATSATLDKNLVDVSEVGRFYYFCKVTSGDMEIYSASWYLRVLPAPEAPVVEDAAMRNGQYYIVPIDGLQLKYGDDSFTTYRKGDQFEVNWGTPEGTVRTYHARYALRTSDDEVNFTCHSEETDFYVWAGYNVNYISESTTFADATVCRNDTENQPHWHIQGASEWGMNNLTYTWYRTKTSATTGGVVVSNEASYNPPIDSVGTYYYYCIIGYSGRTATKTVGPHSVTVNGMNGLDIEDSYFCPDGSQVSFSYADDTYPVYWGNRMDRLNSAMNSRAAGSTDALEVYGMTASSDKAGNSYKHYFKVTDGNGCVTIDSATAHIRDDLSTYILTESLESAEVCEGDEPTLSVNAEYCVNGAGTGAVELTFTWYRNTTGEIDDAVSEVVKTEKMSSGYTSNYVPSDHSGTEYYYYCKITGKVDATALTESYSSVSKVIVHPTPIIDVVTVPAITNEVIETYCTGDIKFTAKDGFVGYVWQSGTYDGSTFTPATNAASAVSGHSFQPDCNALTQPTGFRIAVEDVYGCPKDTVIQLNIHPLGATYYYCGPKSGDSYSGEAVWGLNDVSNWHTNQNCTGDSPSDFDHPACVYIIDNNSTSGSPWTVELKAGQTWNISGAGSRVQVGDGTWERISSNVGGATAKSDWKDGINYKMEFFSTLESDDVTEKFSAVSNYDFRSDAKGFKISGTMNCNNGVVIDVTSGSALEIATDAGNPAIGNCAIDWYNPKEGGNGYDPNASTSYNVWAVPGSSVTYSGTGVRAIQPVSYSQLYIENTSTGAVFPDDYVEVKQVMNVSNPSNVSTTGDVHYVGALEQTIAPIEYKELVLDNVSKKTMGGDVKVTEQLYISPSAKLGGGNDYNVMTITATGENAVVYKGKFEAGNSIFEYVGEGETTVAAMPYYSLALTDVDVVRTETDGVVSLTSVTPNPSMGSPRTLSTDGIVGVAGNMYTSSTASYTVDGSTVEFNGDAQQEIPEFTFYNLAINNTSVENNTTSSMDNLNTVVIGGNVEVTNQLLLQKGILYTDNYADGQDAYHNPIPRYSLKVTNTAADAVGTGHFTSTQDAAFIVGTLERSLPANANGSNVTTVYEFPMGNFSKYYMPLEMSKLTTTGASSVKVSAKDGVAGSAMNSPLQALDHSKFWTIDGVGGYSSASVSIESQDNLGEYNSVAYAQQREGVFETAYGTVNGKAIEHSNDATTSFSVGSGVVTFGKRLSTPHTYYYDCSKTPDADITDINSWWTGERGTGTRATSFTEDDATWIIECNATVSTNPLSITGSNVVVILEENARLNVNNTTAFASFRQVEGSMVNISAQKQFTVYGTHEVGHYAGVNNYGTFDTYSKTFAIDYGAFVNNYFEGTWNMYNSALQVSSSDGSSNSKSGHVVNYGNINMTNSSLYVSGRFTDVKNEDGAVWIIDNTMSANNKSVVFDNVEFRVNNNSNQYVSMECGSAFYVKHSDMTIWYGGMEDNDAFINGDIIVEDGNMLVRRKAQGGGNMNIVGGGCGSIYLLDTDGSGDGILTIQGSGGSRFNVDGTVYAMGIVTQGGSGDEIHVRDGGFLFIGNLGATLSQYSWVFTIKVEEGGTLNYCGNRTAMGDNVGSNAGTLNYAESFYESGLDNPINQGDFSNISGYIHALYSDNEACMADYNARTKNEVNALLPVELTMLYGICIDENTVELRWQTASETNNDYFTILRSFDGINFEEIGIVMGAGTTTEFHNYEYYDTDEKEGVVYYKLRQTDFDGNTTESKVIAVQTCGKNAHFKIKQDEIEVFFRNPQANYVVITSVTGQIFYSKKFTNVEEARIAVPQRKGIYIISVIDSKQITSEKFIR